MASRERNVVDLNSVAGRFNRPFPMSLSFVIYYVDDTASFTLGRNFKQNFDYLKSNRGQQTALLSAHIRLSILILHITIYFIHVDKEQ